MKYFIITLFLFFSLQKTAFAISEEDATDEYEQWVSLSDGGKIFKSGENGVEFIIDLIEKRKILQNQDLVTHKLA